MKLIRNLLAVVGLLALVAGGVAYVRVQGIVSQLEPGMMDMLSKVGARYMENFDPGVAVVKTVQVDEGISAEDVVESMKSLAVQHKMFYAGEALFYKQVEALTGKPYRYVGFYSFCDAMVGMEMIEYNTAYTSFMPCRIALVEDANKRLWLHTMNLDMFIYGGKPLPPKLKEGAIHVRDALDKIMAGAAKGEF